MHVLELRRSQWNAHVWSDYGTRHCDALLVEFSPGKVDDFTTELDCSIPFPWQQVPPVIRVVGLSRRHLFHFNVDLSDCLCWRYPDYTLPEGLCVIQLSSSVVGRKTYRRFDNMKAHGPMQVRAHASSYL